MTAGSHHVGVVGVPWAWPATWSFNDVVWRFLSAEAALTAEGLDALIYVWRPGADLSSVLDKCAGTSMATLVALPAEDRWAALALAGHDIDGILDLSWPAELTRQALRLAIRHAHTGRNVVDIQRVVLETSRKEVEALYDAAVHDGLTGLYNRRYFDDILGREEERARRYHHPFSVVFLDLDDLKAINVTWGHTGGSLALRHLGQVLEPEMRKSNVACRYGGDEFVILLTDTAKSGARVFATHVCEQLARARVSLGGEPVMVTASFGVATFPDDGHNAALVLKRADEALFAAKAQGKARVVCAAEVIEGVPTIPKVPHEG